MDTHRLFNITASLLLLLSFLGMLFMIREVIVRIEDYPDDLSQLEWSVERKTPVNKKETTDYGSAMGLDVSHYQGKIDWNNMDERIAFVICKATEGLSFTDPEFDYNWAQIKASGRVRGAYHFYVASDDPIGQARYFWAAVKTYDDTDLPLVLDIEPEGVKEHITPAKLHTDVLNFLEELTSLSGKKPIIYVDYSFANEYLNNQKFTEYPLWIAEYESESAPKLPDTWQHIGWDFWQRSPSYEEKGISGDVDYDLFDGNVRALKEFARNKNF